MGDRLGELEHGLLFALVALGDGANGRELRAELLRRTRHDVSAGACYTALDRLEAKGLVTSWLGDSTPARGGRRSRHYRIEPAGARALLAMHERLAAAAEGLLPELRGHLPKTSRS